jgi:hypothetical protein
MKKTISFVLVAFLILLGAANSNVVSAQDQPTTKAKSDNFSWSHWGNGSQRVPLYLNAAGDPVVVRVVTDWHCTCHWEYNDEWDWYNQTWMLMRWRGDFTYDGIVYEINDQVTYGKHAGTDWNDPAYYAVEFVSNVKGSNGSHLLASGTLTMYDPDWNWVGLFEYTKIVSN